MTQNDWLAELNRLQNPGETLRVQIPGEGSFDLAEDGAIRPTACDALARWCLARLGLENYGITAPEWSCSYSMRMGDKKAHFAYWHLGGYDVVGIYLADPDTQPRPPRADGRPRPSERGMWEKCIVIPDMPIPEEDDELRPENWEEMSRQERRAWRQGTRPRSHLLYAMALAHFARWLAANPG